MSTIVFAGPSIYGLPPAQVAGFELRPPAACGDLLLAGRDGARVIGLIDGVFGDTASVWHKEILSLLADGIAVYGAASMGALRAAECHPFGMIGVGAIFEDYRSGARVADGDVAVLHAPAALGFAPLTLALVDAEAIVADLRARGDVAGAEAERLLASARRLGFRDRTWPAVLENAGLASATTAAAVERAAATMPGRKAADAAALLERLRAAVPDAVPWRGGRLSRTLFLAALDARVAAGRDGAGSQGAASRPVTSPSSPAA